MPYYNSFHIVEELIKQGKGKLLIAKDNKRTKNLRELALDFSVPVDLQAKSKLDELSNGEHRGFLLELEESALHINKLSTLLKASPQLLVLLDGITDVGNAGAILRSCEQFAVDAVIVPPGNSVAPENLSKLAKSSSGAASLVSIISHNIHQAIILLKKHGFWIYAANMDGIALADVEFTKPMALVLGAEGKGLHNLVLESSDYRVRIPTLGRLDSLNVSVAAGICLYEINR